MHLSTVLRYLTRIFEDRTFATSAEFSRDYSENIELRIDVGHCDRR